MTWGVDTYKGPYGVRSVMSVAVQEKEVVQLWLINFKKVTRIYSLLDGDE